MAAAALFIGAGISAYSSYQQGQERQAAYETEAASKRAQAAQVEIGTNRELELLGRQSDIIHGAQVSAYGHSGVEAGHGSPLLQMEQTRSNLAEQMQAVKDYGAYHANTILTEGNMDQILGGEASDAGFLGALGGAFGAVSKNPYTYDVKRNSGGNL